MSLLMWSQEPERFAILTDSLVLSEQFEPGTFQNKIWPIAPLNLAIGGTGALDLIQSWHRWVTESCVIDLKTLDRFAPDTLRDLWDQILEYRGEAPGTAATTTIYHFGITRGGRAVRYTYRSVTDFEPEFDDRPGRAQKPMPVDGNFLDFLTLEEMIDAGCRIRAQQDELPINERVHIGGELYLTSVTDGLVSTERVHRFHDYIAMAKVIKARTAE